MKNKNKGIKEQWCLITTKQHIIENGKRQICHTDRQSKDIRDTETR